MLVTTGPNANNLPPTWGLAGLGPDPLSSSGIDGVFMEDIADPQEMTAEAQTMGTGRPGVFEFDLGIHPGEMTEQALLGPEDMATTLNNNQLQLYCGLLDNGGNFAVDSFFDVVTGLNVA